ncbi:hypothetical protein BDV25DRAFT_159340 [Aspergillus avenaceus]|uniref:Uncharacterized protein n=1 Tax=Aspergillus avenaceus TaxID=36643 RepID=A0A5N6TNI1_ASPAV|nr:hypothetical protein BDV25DRAFT_159340 [Aspergillus avenaceus]
MASVNSMPAANNASGTSSINPSTQNSSARPSLRSSVSSKADGGRRQSGNPLEGNQRYVVLSIQGSQLFVFFMFSSTYWYPLLLLLRISPLVMHQCNVRRLLSIMPCILICTAMVPLLLVSFSFFSLSLPAFACHRIKTPLRRLAFRAVMPAVLRSFR